MIAMKRNKVGHLIRTAVLLLLPLGAGAQAPAPRHSAEVAWGVSVPLGTGYPDKTGAAAFSLRYEYRFAQRWAAESRSPGTVRPTTGCSTVTSTATL